MREFFERNKAALSPVLEFPFEEPDVYREFLAQTYHYVAHTTRLASLTASHVGPERDELHSQFLRSVIEEKGHHLLAKSDLQELGGELVEYPELPLTSALYMTQYYQVRQIGPTSIFGYILALEGLAALHGEQLYARVRNAHGEAASTFVGVHATEDPGHLDGVLSTVALLPESEQEAIRANFFLSSSLYAQFLRSVSAR